MKIKKLSLVFFSLLLSSCLAAVVAGTAAGLVVYDKRSVATIESDARIFYNVHSKIVKDPAFSESRVVVVSFNETVLLLGQVPSASLRMKAEKVAHDTEDVRRVYNEITIDEPIAYSQMAQDSWITGQTRSYMLTKKGLSSGSIRIVTEDGVVYLMGMVTPKQASLAVDVARRVDGVNKVVKIFQTSKA